MVLSRSLPTRLPPRLQALLLATALSCSACGGGGSDTGSAPVSQASPASPAAAASAVYRVTFHTDWSASNFPTQFPANRHFAGLVGATHGPDVNFWAEGGQATLGIQNMAELGAKTALLAEVDAARAAGTAEHSLSGPGISSSQTDATLDVEVSLKHSRVTLVSMVAPSPSWFVGVHDLPLLRNDQWVDKLDIPLVVYDAGTDAGASFASPDQARSPHLPIQRLTSAPSDTDFRQGVHRSSGAYVASYTFERVR